MSGTGIEWTVFTVITALVTFVGVFIKYSSNLTRTLTTLNVTLQSLQEQIYELKKEKKEFNKDVLARLDKHGDILIRHENELENRKHRIDRLEDIVNFMNKNGGTYDV